MAGIWSELKRRNVIRVTGFYVLAAWILLQAAETIGGLIDLPAWVGPVTITLVVFAFPAAVYVGWTYTLEDGELKRISRNQDVVAPGIYDYIFLVAWAALIVFGTYQLFLWDPGFGLSDDSGEAISSEARRASTGQSTAPAGDVSRVENSIAVLPFLNMSSDTEQEYFSDGIAEEVLNVLARTPGLQVTSRTSSFAFKGKQLSIPEIAASLGVNYILEGSIRKAGNQVRITAQLIQVGSDKHLFSQTWDRGLDNVFAVQDEIAGKIGEILKLKLVDSAESPGGYQTLSAELLDKYLQATQLMAATGFNNATRAQELLQQIIAEAPHFSQAHSHLANVFLSMIQIGNIHPLEALAKAMPPAELALQLDPGNAEALNILSYIYRSQGRTDEAERMLRQALIFEPGNAPALRQAISKSAYGREFKPVDELVERLLKVDPLFENTMVVVQDYYRRAGDFDKALQTTERMRDIEGATLLYTAIMDVNDYHGGGPQETLRYTRQSYELEPRFGESVARLIMAHLDVGDPANAEKLLREAPALESDPLHKTQSQMMLDLYRGKGTSAQALAHNLLDADMPDRYGSKAFALRVLLLQASESQETLKALIYRYFEVYPELMEGLVPNAGQLPPIFIKYAHFMAANDLAHLYRRIGDEVAAQRLDDAIVESLPKWPRLSVLGSGFADVEYYARNGQIDRALQALEQALAEGNHHFWWFFLDHSPHLQAIRQEPRFGKLRSQYFAQFDPPR